MLAPGRAPATLHATDRLRRSSLATQPPYRAAAQYATAMAAFDDKGMERYMGVVYLSIPLYATAEAEPHTSPF